MEDSSLYPSWRKPQQLSSLLGDWYKERPILVLSNVVYYLPFCGNINYLKEKYNKEEIIGKTSNEIIDAYGEFDNTIGIDIPDENGVYRNCKCGYTIWIFFW